MSTTTHNLPLHSSRHLPRRFFNRVFALIYSAAISALLYRHAKTLIHPTTTTSFIITLSMLVSDTILAFMWVNSQAFLMNPVETQPSPENLEKVFHPGDFPALDVFICTADPYKEPPITVANTALSVMAYEYPVEKLSVYVSDDGGSEMTLFALMEAAEFAKDWLPFCSENRVVERCPDAYFRSNLAANPETQRIKGIYENMKTRLENVVERGYITDEYKASGAAAEAFCKWTKDFTSQDHPAVVQVVLQSGSHGDKDPHAGRVCLPNLIYVSRQKSRAYPHQFKAGALNTLLRVSATMTNAPIVLTLDCDMISNDPSTPLKMLCYFMDNSIKPNLAYVQFPVCFSGLNKADIYGSELKRPYHINPVGLNGLLGPDYFGSGTFFSRRAFYGGPSSMFEPDIPELSPNYIVKKPINDQSILVLAHHVASCDYETNSHWGSKIGVSYGSLVEDSYTGFRLHCEGWMSIFVSPKRPAFLSETPISLNDVIIQMKRWAVGLLEVAVSMCSPLIFGTRFLGPSMALCYSHYALWAIWSFPLVVYAFLPQTAMLNNISIFPKVSDPCFFLYMFLFAGAYGQDFLEFILAEGTALRWWSDQRIWIIRGLTSNLFGTLQYFTNHLGIGTRGFDVTNKVNDNEQKKRYDEGKFEFGVPSPMFVPLSTAAILNLIAFVYGIFQVLRGRNMDGMLAQMVLACFGVANSLPVYESMFLRTDKGRMPTQITLVSAFLSWLLIAIPSFVVKV